MDAWFTLIIGFVFGLFAKLAYDKLLGGQETKPVGQEEEFRARLAALEGENKELRFELDQQPEVVVKEKDRLEKIKGVGPVLPIVLMRPVSKPLPSRRRSLRSRRVTSSSPKNGKQLIPKAG